MGIFSFNHSRTSCYGDSCTKVPTRTPLICKDCFFYFGADLEMKLDIHWFEVEFDYKLSGGLSLHLDLAAHSNTPPPSFTKLWPWIRGSHSYTFMIGPVPLQIGFGWELGGYVSAGIDSVALSGGLAKVDAVAGIGGSFSTKHGSHWNLVKPPPIKFSGPRFSMKGHLDVGAYLDVTTSFGVKIFGLAGADIGVKFHFPLYASLSFSVDTAGKCPGLLWGLDVKLDLQLSGFVAVHLDVRLLFIHIHKNNTWDIGGVKNLFTVPVVTERCIGLPTLPAEQRRRRALPPVRATTAAADTNSCSSLTPCKSCNQTLCLRPEAGRYDDGTWFVPLFLASQFAAAATSPGLVGTNSIQLTTGGRTYSPFNAATSIRSGPLSGFYADTGGGVGVLSLAHNSESEYLNGGVDTVQDGPAGSMVNRDIATEWPALQTTLNSWLSSLQKLLVVGHGVGGACATYAASSIASSGGSLEVRLVTFGAAAAGDEAFSTWAASQLMNRALHLHLHANQLAFQAEDFLPSLPAYPYYAGPNDTLFQLCSETCVPTDRFSSIDPYATFLADLAPACASATGACCQGASCTASGTASAAEWDECLCDGVTKGSCDPNINPGPCGVGQGCDDETKTNLQLGDFYCLCPDQKQSDAGRGRPGHCTNSTPALPTCGESPLPQSDPSKPCGGQGWVPSQLPGWDLGNAIDTSVARCWHLRPLFADCALTGQYVSDATGVPETLERAFDRAGGIWVEASGAAATVRVGPWYDVLFLPEQDPHGDYDFIVGDGQAVIVDEANPRWAAANTSLSNGTSQRRAFVAPADPSRVPALDWAPVFGVSAGSVLSLTLSTARRVFLRFPVVPGKRVLLSLKGDVSGLQARLLREGAGGSWTDVSCVGWGGEYDLDASTGEFYFNNGGQGKYACFSRGCGQVQGFCADAAMSDDAPAGTWVWEIVAQTLPVSFEARVQEEKWVTPGTVSKELFAPGRTSYVCAQGVQVFPDDVQPNPTMGVGMSDFGARDDVSAGRVQLGYPTDQTQESRCMAEPSLAPHCSDLNLKDFCSASGSPPMIDAFGMWRLYMAGINKGKLGSEAAVASMRCTTSIPLASASPSAGMIDEENSIYLYPGLEVALTGGPTDLAQPGSAGVCIAPVMDPFAKWGLSLAADAQAYGTRSADGKSCHTSDAGAGQLVPPVATETIFVSAASLQGTSQMTITFRGVPNTEPTNIWFESSTTRGVDALFTMSGTPVERCALDQGTATVSVYLTCGQWPSGNLTEWLLSAQEDDATISMIVSAVLASDHILVTLRTPPSPYALPSPVLLHFDGIVAAIGDVPALEVTITGSPCPPAPTPPTPKPPTPPLPTPAPGTDAAKLMQLVSGVTPTPSGWGGPGLCSSWTGVACSKEGQVRNLTLCCGGYSGTLDLTALPAGLQRFWMYSNNLSGTLDLTALPAGVEELNLYQNHFSGTPDLSALPASLHLLDLRANDFCGGGKFTPSGGWCFTPQQQMCSGSDGAFDCAKGSWECQQACPTPPPGPTPTPPAPTPRPPAPTPAPPPPTPPPTPQPTPAPPTPAPPPPSPPCGEKPCWVLAGNGADCTTTCKGRGWKCEGQYMASQNCDESCFQNVAKQLGADCGHWSDGDHNPAICPSQATPPAVCFYDGGYYPSCDGGTHGCQRFCSCVDASSAPSSGK
eukprot:Hpha_TRINITY_DN16890_c0_g3::TRINITY_DN16890_c0_g3_i1::g.153481::m.153481